MRSGVIVLLIGDVAAVQTMQALLAAQEANSALVVDDPIQSPFPRVELTAPLDVPYVRIERTSPADARSLGRHPDPCAVLRQFRGHRVVKRVGRIKR